MNIPHRINNRETIITSLQFDCFSKLIFFNFSTLNEVTIITIKILLICLARLAPTTARKSK